MSRAGPFPTDISSRKNSLLRCSMPSGHFSRVTRQPDGNATPHFISYEISIRHDRRNRYTAWISFLCSVVDFGCSISELWSAIPAATFESLTAMKY